MENTFNILGFIVILSSLVSTFFCIKIDAELDSDKIKNGTWIDHTREAWQVMVLMTVVFTVINLFNLISYDFNSNLVLLIAMWVIWFASARFMFFSPYLNRLRNLPENYIGSGPQAAKIDKLLSKASNQKWVRLTQFMFSSFLLVHFVMNYYGAFHSNLENYFAWIVLACMAVWVGRIVYTQTTK